MIVYIGFHLGQNVSTVFLHRILAFIGELCHLGCYFPRQLWVSFVCSCVLWLPELANSGRMNMMKKT